jgi:hypothetical protein
MEGTDQICYVCLFFFFLHEAIMKQSRFWHLPALLLLLLMLLLYTASEGNDDEPKAHAVIM